MEFCWSAGGLSGSCSGAPASWPTSARATGRRRTGDSASWCEDPADRRYNRPFRRSANEPGDRLWRDDGLYDLVIEISHNTRPRVAGRGSAVFLHVARPERSATAGCVALAAPDLRRLLARLGPRTQIDIRP